MIGELFGSLLIKLFHIAMWMLLKPEGHTAFFVATATIATVCLILLHFLKEEKPNDEIQEK